MAGVREAGRQGERDAGVDPSKPKERVESIKETKNVKEFKVTNQIKDFVKEAKASLREFTVKIRESTRIGPSAQKFINENGVKVETPTGARPVEMPVIEPMIPEPVVVRVPIEPIILP